MASSYLSGKLVPLSRSSKLVFSRVKLLLAATLMLGQPVVVLANAPVAHTANWAPTQPNPLQHHNTFSTPGTAHSLSHAWAGMAQSNNHFANNFTHLLPVNAFGLPSNLPAGQQYQLDLSSSGASIVLGSKTLNGLPAVTISIDGQKHSFSAGDHVTAAEFVAIQQVASAGTQTLVLSSGGVASAGTFSLNTVASANVGELVVPHGVTAIDYASSGKNINLGGDLINYGTIYGVSTNPSFHTATITGLDIVNEKGGLITTTAPSSLLVSIAGALSQLNLTLGAVDSITNSGTISSSGALNLLSQTGSITNHSGAVIQARHDLNIASGNGNLTNNGTVSSALGNINITNPNNSGDINIFATAGSFVAKSGDINFRDASYSGSGNINLAGGNYLSRNLNLNSGQGEINGSLDDVTGMVNTQAAVDHLAADTAVLSLGKNCVSGDPTYVNLGGDIRLVGPQNFGENVAILASANITAAPGASITTSGHDVTLIAGAKITTSSGGAHAPKVDGLGSGDQIFSTAVVTMKGTGGNIDLRGAGSGVLIDTSTSADNTNAGNIVLAAISNGPVGGQILLPLTSNINATATGILSQGGSVSIIAGGATSKTSLTLQTGTINTGNLSPLPAGTITLATAAPTSSDFKVITFDNTGTIISKNAVTAGTVSPGGQIKIGGDLITAAPGGLIASATGGSTGGGGGMITVHAGNNISANKLLTFGGGGQGGTDTFINGGSGGQGGDIFVTSDNGSITLNGQVNTSGGGGGGGYSVGAGAGGAGGLAGQIALKASNPIVVNAPVYAINGGAGGAGDSGHLVGGGGGGSFGGGGGGGGSSLTAGNGGGGFGGGGGGGLQSTGVSGQLGGAGGGYTGGQGATGGGQGGTNNISGVGAGSAVVGSTIGQGGLAADAKTAGNSGISATTASGGNSVTIISSRTSFINANLLAGLIQVKANAAPFTVTTTMSASTLIQLDAPNISTTATGFLDTVALDLQSGNAGIPGDIGSSDRPLLSNASSFLITTNSSTAGNVFLQSSFAGTAQLTGATAGSLNLYMTDSKSSLQLAGTTTLRDLTIFVRNTIDFGANSTFQVGDKTQSGNLFLQANNLAWNTAASTPLVLNASAQASNLSGGSIYVTANQLNSTFAVLGTGAGELSLQATGGFGGSGKGDGGQITLNTKDLIVNNSAAISVATLGASGNGGQITLFSNTVSSASAITLKASGGGAGATGAGNGGTIIVSVQSQLTVTIGSGPGEFILNAANGQGKSAQTSTGGSITVLANNDLIVDSSFLKVSNVATNVNGGTIKLFANTIANSKVAVPLTLSVTGLGSGNGGTIFLVINKSQPLTLGGKGDYVLSAQGGTTGGNGGKIQVDTPSDIYFETNPDGTPTSALINPQSANGGGGSYEFLVNSLNNGAPGLISGVPLVLNASGVGNGDGGRIYLNSNGTTTFNIGTAKVTGTISPGGGNLTLIAQNGLAGTTAGDIETTMPLATLNIADIGAIKILNNPGGATQANINGGIVQLSGGAITYTNSATAPLIIDARGLGSGNGGVASVVENGIGAARPTLIVGTGAGQFELLASSGKNGGDGGRAVAISSGNLIVNPAAVSVAPQGKTGNGGEINLQATDNTAGAFLQVNGPLNLAGKGTGNGGKLSISASSSSPFTLGVSAATKGNFNGLKGAPNLAGKTGGQLQVSSSGNIVSQTSIATPGTINLSSSKDIQVLAKLGGTATSQIQLNAAGSIYGTNTGSVAGNQITLLSQKDISGVTLTKGVLTPSANLPFFINGTAVTVQSSLGSVNASDKSSAETVTLADSFAAQNFSFATAKSLAVQVGTSTLSTGVQALTVTLASGMSGAIKTLANSTVTAGTITLKTGSLTSDIAVSPSILSVTAKGPATITSASTGALVLAQASATKTLTIHATGHLQIGTVNTTPVGNSTTTITINAGDIASTSTLVAKSLTLITGDGDIGSNLAPLLINTPLLSINSGGAVTINDSSTKTTILSPIGAGSLILNTGAATTINSITTTSGALSITSNLPVVNGALITNPAPTDKFAPGALTTVKNAVITSPNGPIALENANIKAGSIKIATGTVIMTGRPSGGGGSISITIGAPPAIPVVGPAIVNAAITQIGNGQVFAGTNGISANISKGLGNTLIADMANIIFSTGNLKASAINLGGNTTIIADPPLSGGAVNNFNPQIGGQLLAAPAPSAPSLATTAPASMPAIVNPSPGRDWQQTITLATTGAPINFAALQSTQTYNRPTWASETELISGQIPANWICDSQLGLADEESSIFQYDRGRLSQGTAIFAPLHDREVVTPLGKIHIKANSIVLVTASPDRLSVFDLHDRSNNAVVLHCGEHQVKLRPGQNVTLTRKEPRDFAEINPAQLFAYRKITLSRLGESSAYTSEFSLPQAIAAIPSLRRMISSDKAEHRRLAEPLLKTMSILMQIDRTGGSDYKQFRPVVRTGLVAMAEN